MSTLYLHIGTPKTGTTAIQHFLRTNQKTLASKGYIFPLMKLRFKNVPQKRNAHFLIDRFYNKEAAGTPEYEKEIEECYAKLQKLLKKNENIILTDEAVWHVCKKIDGFWENLYERVTSWGHELKLIVYLRKQDEFIQSYWKYKVLDKETCSFMEYVNSSKYNFFPLQYYSHLSSIASVTGKDNIIVRVYEKEQYEGPAPTIISDFMHVIGLELTDEYNIETDLQNTNVDFICTEIKRKLNYIPEFRDKRGYIRDYMTEISEKYKKEGKYQFKSLFMPEDQDEFLKKYEEENRKVAVEWLGREDGRLFYSPVSYDEKPKEFTSEDFVVTCGEIFSMIERDKQKAIKKSGSYGQESEGGGEQKTEEHNPMGKLKRFIMGNK